MTMDDNMKQKILEQIEEQHLEPRATWRFRLERMLKHSAVAFLFALTALGLAGSVYILVQNGTLDDLRLGPRWAHPAFFDFPWQLLVLVVVLGILSFVVLRRTARLYRVARWWLVAALVVAVVDGACCAYATNLTRFTSVSYTHLRAHETRHDLVCRLLLEKKKKKKNNITHNIQ